MLSIFIYVNVWDLLRGPRGRISCLKEWQTITGSEHGPISCGLIAECKRSACVGLQASQKSVSQTFCMTGWLLLWLYGVLCTGSMQAHFSALPGLTVNVSSLYFNSKHVKTRTKAKKKAIESIWPKSELYLYCNHQHTHLPAVSTATGTISNPNKLCFICVRAAGKSDEEYSHVISFCSWHFEFCRQRRTRMDQCLHATWTLDSWQFWCWFTYCILLHVLMWKLIHICIYRFASNQTDNTNKTQRDTLCMQTLIRWPSGRESCARFSKTAWRYDS